MTPEQIDDVDRCSECGDPDTSVRLFGNLVCASCAYIMESNSTQYATERDC